MDSRRLWIGVALFGSMVVAQDQRTPVVVFGMHDVPALLEAWAETSVGALAAHEEVAPAVEKVLTAIARTRQSERELIAALFAEGVELDPWDLFCVLQPGLDIVGEHPLADCRGAGFAMYASTEGPSPMPMTVSQVRPHPRVEGRWAMEFERAWAARSRSPSFEAVDGVSAGHHPVSALRLSSVEEDEFGDVSYFRQPSWSIVSPAALTRGFGSVEELPVPEQLVPLESMAPPGHRGGGFGVRIYLEAYLGLMMGGVALPAEFHMVGFPSVSDLRWFVGCEGERCLDEVFVTASDRRTGVLGALLAAAESDEPPALPVQPIPRGALAQVRVGLDMATLRQSFDELFPGPWPEGLVDDVAKAFTGGVALGAAAPAPGGLVPRLFGSLGIADREAFDRALERLLPQGDDVEIRELELAGVTCSLLRVDGMPQGLEPAWCVRDGQFHVAESGRSLKALLRELTRDGAPEAMDVGEAPIPEGRGDLVSTVDVRFDEVAIYRAFLTTWLPLFVLTQGVDECLVLPDEMPSVEIVAEHCGATRGVLRRDGDSYRLQHLGVLGGPVPMALAMVFGPMLSHQVATSYLYDGLAPALMRHRVETRIWPAFEAFRQAKGRPPESLAELVQSGLDADALFLPGDDRAEPVAGIEEGRTSFRYFPKPEKMEGYDGPVMVRFAAFRERYGSRSVVGDDGALSEVEGEGGDSDMAFEAVPSEPKVEDRGK